MPTREQLESALRNADAAGDSSAAKQIANVLKSGDFEGGVPLASNLEEIGMAPEMNEFSLPSFLASAGALFTFDDKEVGDILQKQLGAEVLQDAEGEYVAKMPSGGYFAINKPGMSGQDVIKVLGSMAAFTPAGRAGSLGGMAVGAAGTQAAIEAGQEVVGGEFDPETVALTGLAAPAGQFVGSKIGQGLQQVGETAAARRIAGIASPSVQRLKSEASAIYSKIDELGVAFKPERFSSFAKKTAKKIENEGFDVDLHPRIAVALKRLTTSGDEPLSMSKVDNLRRVVQEAAKSDNASEARLGSMIIDDIDNFVENAGVNALSGDKGVAVGSLFKEARGLWKRARKGEMIDEAIEKAGRQASGFENGLRSQFRALLNNKKKMRGFTAEEKKAMERVVQGGKAENIAKHLGKFGFSEGQAGSMLLGSLGVAGGAAVGGPAGAAAIPIIGQSARKIAQTLTRKNAELARRLIVAGSNAEDIAKSYIRSVPKSKRSVEELTGLFLENNAAVEAARKSSNKLIADAAYFASIINAAKPIDGLDDNGLSEQNRNNGN